MGELISSLIFSRIGSHFIDSTEPCRLPSVPLHSYISFLSPFGSPRVLHNDVVHSLWWSVSNGCYSMIKLGSTGSIENALHKVVMLIAVIVPTMSVWVPNFAYPAVELEISSWSFYGHAKWLVCQCLYEAGLIVLRYVLIARDCHYLQFPLKKRNMKISEHFPYSLICLVQSNVQKWVPGLISW